MADNGTGKALVEHWAWAAEKGLILKSSARSMAVSCRRVLEVEQDWEVVDVTTLDIDEFSRRFKTLRALDYKPSSLGDYASRFRRAVLSYREFLREPSKWQFRSRRTNPAASRPKTDQPDSHDAVGEDRNGPAGLQQYVYPFRKNVLATLTIPQDATSAEIKRLIAWAQTLAMDYEGT